MTGSGRRLRSWLHVADHPAWHAKRYYSPRLADALAYAYDSLHSAHQRPDPYFSAFRALAPFRDLPVCREQRLNLKFALALAYAGDGTLPQAFDCFSAAWEIAERLRDWGAQAEIGYAAGALWQSQGQYTDAYEVYQDALEALQRLERSDVPADAAFEFDLVLRLAACAFELGWFPVCLRRLDEAYTLRAVSAPEAAEEAASLSWIDAQLARVRGQPLRALNQAAAAADLLLTHGRPINMGRAHTMLAESALDIFELSKAANPAPDLSPSPVGTTSRVQLTPAALLKQAREAAGVALELARELGDPIGATMARLAQQRATRLTRHPGGEETGVVAAEKLLRTAVRLDDPSLIGRAQTALADELLAAGHPDAARTTYRNTIRRLEEHQLGGFAFWPRRTLRELDGEQS